MNFQDLKNKCIALFNKHCETRDESHGIHHAIRVLNTSVEISKDYDLTKEENYIMCAVAMLHDFADHKYSSGTNLEEILKFFLFDVFGKKTGLLILSIIDKISFSKEKKLGIKDWKTLAKLWIRDIGKRGLIIRNIVSDADKIDASGIIGLHRCIQYTTHVRNGKITHEELVYEVDKHINEKLGILDRYCRTSAGIFKIECKTAELIKEFNSWKDKI